MLFGPVSHEVVNVEAVVYFVAVNRVCRLR